MEQNQRSVDKTAETQVYFLTFPTIFEYGILLPCGFLSENENLKKGINK